MSLGLSGLCLINDFESDSFIFCWKLTHICEEKSKWASINKHILLRCSLPPPSAHCSVSSADTNSFYSNAAFLRLTSPSSRLPHGNINMGGDEPAFMCHFHTILSYFDMILPFILSSGRLFWMISYIIELLIGRQDVTARTFVSSWRLLKQSRSTLYDRCQMFYCRF